MPRKIQLVLLFCACLQSLGPAPPESWHQPPAQVIIIRHAETPSERSATGLSLKGQERAMALVPLLSRSYELINYGLPVALFVTKVAPGSLGQFTQETLEPLSRFLRLSTDAHYAAPECAALAQEILTNRRYERRTVVVCWDREYIPVLAAALGVKTPLPWWSESAYDRVWIITLTENKVSLTDLPQRLMFGDSPK